MCRYGMCNACHACPCVGFAGVQKNQRNFSYTPPVEKKKALPHLIAPKMPIFSNIYLIPTILLFPLKFLMRKLSLPFKKILIYYDHIMILYG